MISLHTNQLTRFPEVMVLLVLALTSCTNENQPVNLEPDIHVNFIKDLRPELGLTKDADTTGPCIPICDEKECGPDGCGGECGECAAPSSCSDSGICVEMDCSGKELELSGVFANSIEDFTFDSVQVALFHKKDIDPVEDGCIARIDLTFRKGTGCTLHLEAEGALNTAGEYRLSSISFKVDSQCPGFSDALEGEYIGLENLTAASITMEHSHIMVDNVESWCFPSSLTVHLAGTLYSMAAGAQLEIRLTTLTITGSLLSIGDENLNCPCEPDCSGKVCGSDGCGFTCGDCGQGFYCNAGSCEKGDCVPQCEEIECGFDGCGGTCGDCPDGYFCTQGICKEGDCIPECTGKKCGPDGCGDNCGSCQCGEVCEGGNCIFHACDGKDCGDDGCGGECGICGEGMACSEGTCIAVGCHSEPLSVEGDFNNSVSPITFDSAAATIIHKRDIDEWEDGCIASVELLLKKGSGCVLKLVAGGSFDLTGHMIVQQVEFTADSQCPNFPDVEEGLYIAGPQTTAWLDVGVDEVPGYDVPESCFNTWMKVHLEGALSGSGVDKNLVLQASEITVTGDFVSSGDYGASCPCKPSCLGKECGDAGCGFTCGVCGCGYECIEGSCEYTACNDIECGNDGCGGDCGDCGEFPGSYCGALQQCQCDPDCAGKNCGGDGCGGSCGDCVCGESCDDGQCVFGACIGKECGDNGCGGSCGECPGIQDLCMNGLCECQPNCIGKECGNDGCGGECGSCNCGEECTSGTCLFTACNNKQCGSDGCWGDCGQCGCGEECLAGACEFVVCDGKECGSDGCGGSCGQCDNIQEECIQGTCICFPNCAQKECGSDGCGATCGLCIGPQDECVNGTCVCQPDCSDKQCGSNGCSGNCGECTSSQECQDGICVIVFWTDPTSGLTWEVRANDFSTYNNSWFDAVEYCDVLDLNGGGWHLPTINEIRSLVRGCPDSEIGGKCPVLVPECLQADCMTEDCWACSESNGPADGLYLPEEMPLCSPPGGAIGLWSSSPVDDMLSQKWVIQFQFAYIIYRHINDKGMDVRCVR